MSTVREVQEKHGFGRESRWNREFPGRLLVYPSGKSRSGERIAVRIAFVTAALAVGVFSVTRLLPIRWPWLVPVSFGAVALLMTVLLFSRLRERPVCAIRVTADGVCLDSLSSGRFGKRADLSLHPLADVVVEALGNDVPPEGFRMRVGHDVLCECRMAQVRDVSLYLGIWEYFSMDPGSRPPIPARRPIVAKGKLFWMILSWGLIVFLMAIWRMYENHLALSPK